MNYFILQFITVKGNRGLKNCSACKKTHAETWVWCLGLTQKLKNVGNIKSRVSYTSYTFLKLLNVCDAHIFTYILFWIGFLLMWRDPMTITILTKENCQLVLACSFRDLVNYCHSWKHAAFRKPWYRRKNWEFHIWIQWRKKEQMRYSMACASEASKLAIL